MADQHELEGLPKKQKVRQLTIGAWANGAAAVLFLGLFLQAKLRECIPLTKYEEVVNARMEDLKKQIDRQIEQKIQPQVQDMKAGVDTLSIQADSLKKNRS